MLWMGASDQRDGWAEHKTRTTCFSSRRTSPDGCCCFRSEPQLEFGLSEDFPEAGNVHHTGAHGKQCVTKGGLEVRVQSPSETSHV